MAREVPRIGKDVTNSPGEKSRQMSPGFWFKALLISVENDVPFTKGPGGLDCLRTLWPELGFVKSYEAMRSTGREGTAAVRCDPVAGRGRYFCIVTTKILGRANTQA